MKKLKPVGILAIVVGIIFVLGTVALLGKYIWSATRSLESMGDVSIAHTPPSPALASVTKPSPPVPPPTLGPLPEGWRIERDPFTGDNYLAPSFEVETAVIDAFEAVLSLEVIEDRSNEEALAYDRNAALSRAEELATTGVIESYRILTHVELGTLGPKNLVKCQDLDTCEIAQAKLGVVAYIAYDPDMCAGLNAGIPAQHKGANGNFMLAGDGSHCVTRFVEVDDPRAVYLATVEFSRDQWIVTNLDREPIPEPEN